MSKSSRWSRWRSATGVARHTVHRWIRRYQLGGLAALVERSKRPKTCPHQTPLEVKARICALRRLHPEWSPRRLVYELQRKGVKGPGRSSVYRALVRNRLIDPRGRRRRRADYRRWERGSPMELWQMDSVNLVLADQSKVSVITGIDDHSRFCVAAKVTERDAFWSSNGDESSA